MDTLVNEQIHWTPFEIESQIICESSVCQESGKIWHCFFYVSHFFPSMDVKYCHVCDAQINIDWQYMETPTVLNAKILWLHLYFLTILIWKIHGGHIYIYMPLTVQTIVNVIKRLELKLWKEPVTVKMIWYHEQIHFVFPYWSEAKKYHTNTINSILMYCEDSIHILFVVILTHIAGKHQTYPNIHLNDCHVLLIRVWVRTHIIPVISLLLPVW